MMKFAFATLGIAAFVGGLVGVYCVARTVPIHMVDYQPAAWGALALSFIGLGVTTKASI